MSTNDLLKPVRVSKTPRTDAVLSPLLHSANASSQPAACPTMTTPSGAQLTSGTSEPAYSVDDVLNGLKHLADDHTCCRVFTEWTAAYVRQLHDALGAAELWINNNHGGGEVEVRRKLRDAMNPPNTASKRISPR